MFTNLEAEKEARRLDIKVGIQNLPHTQFHRLLFCFLIHSPIFFLIIGESKTR